MKRKKRTTISELDVLKRTKKTATFYIMDEAGENPKQQQQQH